MITLALICITCATYLLWKQYYTRSDEPPVLPGSWPFVGHALPFIMANRDIWGLVYNFAELSTSMGGVTITKFGPKTLYGVADPDDIFTVANTCLDKDDFYDFAKPWLGEGLATGKVSIWKNHRKLLSPAFSQGVLDRFLGIFNSQSKKLVNDLKVEDGKGFFDHWDHIRSNALESICLTTLGVDFTDSLLNKNYMEMVESVFSSILERILKMWWYSPHTFRFSALKKKQDDCIQILHNLPNTVLQKRKIEFASNAQRTVTSGTRFKIFMDLLLELKFERDLLSDEEIRAHVDTIIVAGHDTTAHTLRYTLILLGTHPEVQEKVFSELKKVLGDDDRDVTKQDLPQLVYLDAVIKESLRIHTVMPIVGRKLDRDVKLSTRFKIFMDLLLELKFERDLLSDEEIRAHVDTIIVAGHDTTAHTLRYTLILLGTHPEVQEKVFSELKKVLGDDDRDVTKQDLPQLVYLDAVIKESLRIHTVMPIVGRKLDRDVKLKNCTLLAGRTCVLLLFAANRHPVWGPDRHEFSPERWLDSSRLPENPNAFAGFSIGRRMCIAKSYAMMSMKTTLAHLVRHYRITAEDAPLKLQYEIFLKPVSGHLISIERRI